MKAHNPPATGQFGLGRRDWTALVRGGWFACAILAAIVLLGALPVYYNHYAGAIRAAPAGLSGLDLTLIGVSDLAGGLISYALALFLFWRKPDDHMALFSSFFFLITAVASNMALDYFLTAYFGLPSTYQIWSDLQTPLWILIFSVFPDGRFVPRWTRWLLVGSILLACAWFGGGTWRLISDVLVLPLFILVTYALVYRYRRVSSHAERKQTKWWVFGLFVAAVLSVVASLIYDKVSPPLINVTPIFVTIAIVRSRLWDIDVIIRRTLIYGTLTSALAVVYFSSVLLLEQVLNLLTGQGQTDVVIVLSTLAIAALFAPLRRRIQQVIDRRFYRRKYDAQEVLAAFGAKARDEVDLNELTQELESVVGETMQPEYMSLWLWAPSSTGSSPAHEEMTRSGMGRGSAGVRVQIGEAKR